MKLRILTLAGMLLLTAASIATALPSVHVDFQVSASGVTAPGYVAIAGNAPRWDTSTQVSLGGGVQGAWTTYAQCSPRDRSTSDPLLRDFVMWTSGYPADTFQVRGLPQGVYNLTLYATDPSYPTTGTLFDIDGNNDAVSDMSVTIQASLSETAKTVSVTISSAGILSIKISAITGKNGVCNGFDLVSAAPDIYPPAAVSNLAASLAGTVVDRAHKVTLNWTAPADDNGAWGSAASYDLRYSKALITDANWDAATPVAGLATPAAAGQLETFVVAGLTPGTTYFFAIKSADSVGNISLLSNVCSITTGAADVIPPAAVGDLAGAVGPNWVQLSWTATGDDGLLGQATQYELRYSLQPINEANFSQATLVAGVSAPKIAGAAETFGVHGLTAGTQYYFALKVIDLWPNASALSNVFAPLTLAADPFAPGAIVALTAAPQINSVYLSWPAPADVGTAGMAGYDVRYSTSPINEGNWAAATPATGEPTPSAPGVIEHFTVTGLGASTTYYFAVKSFDYAEPSNVSTLSNIVVATTRPPILPVTVHNPWIVNDRVADCRTLQSMANTFGNAYTSTGVTVGLTDQDRAINEYNNFKRREYHWSDDPPNRADVVENINIFGHSLCGGQAAQNSTILNAMGLHARTGSINKGAHTLLEVSWGGAWHLMDTFTTMYVFTRTNPPTIASAAQISADKTLMTGAVAEGRTCPGYLLCGDDVVGFASGCDSWSIIGDPGSFTPVFSMNMDLRIGQTFKRTWESWANQYPTPITNSDAAPGPDAPYHHEANKDWKDTVNIPYWEPYQLTAAQSAAVNIPMIPTYRRWANGTDTLAPDFRSPAYQACLAGSANIATFSSDGKTPDLHPAATGTLANVVFHVQLPFYITDCNITGTFTRTSAGDINKIYFGTTSNPTTLIWTNSALGTTQLNNLSIRTNVFAKFDFYIKVELQSTSQITDAGVSNLVITTTYEHNKGAMAYLDKGANNITVTFDNAAELQASGNNLHVTYKWKEYDGTDWTIDRQFDTRIIASPATFTITAGGTKVPRTESITMAVEPPFFDPVAPSPVTDLVAATAGSGKIALTWTATASDGSDPSTGPASAYDVRYSTSPITDNASFAAATQVTGVPAPKSPGSLETFTVTGLQGSTRYYFGIKVLDTQNTSALSNVPVWADTTAPDLTPPQWVGNLVGKPSKTAGGVDLTWTAPADYGPSNSGPYTCTSYELRYSTSPIAFNDGGISWSAATLVAGATAPKAPGSAETFTVTGLTGGATYYFAIKSKDDSNNLSAVSNCAAAKASVIGEKTLQFGLNGYSGEVDSYVSVSTPTSNFGTYERMTICGYGAGNYQRGLLKFDLSSLPAAATLTSATLYLYSYDATQTKGNTGFYGVYPASKAWSDSQVTWNNATTSGAWTTPGGDCAAAADATSPKQAVASVWYPFDVTSRVQAWVTVPAGNFGWIVKCTDESKSNQDRFYQSDTANAAFRPKLVVSDLVAPVQGDINGDVHVDVLDLLFVAGSWGADSGVDRAYDPRCDLNSDGAVDVVDLLILADNWGH